MKKLMAFCDLPWEPECLELASQNRAVKTDVMMNAREGINTNADGRWKDYARYLHPAADILGIDVSEYV